MTSFLDIFSDVAKLVAAINIIAAMYFHYRYTVGPSSTRNYRNAVFHWGASGVAVAAAAGTDNALSGAVTFVIVLGALIAPAVPILFLRKIRTERTPTMFDKIDMDDIIDRARTTSEKD
ncbi:hypothetical protein CH282_15970 [Rhodococcus sp. 06-418-1B]|nr:hypothetical protein [Rhodococcus sp. 06-418-1B]OZC83446.1 hypothetical protein CH282_15970 [Rhodococcus sp. 06-418-1B]